MAEWNQLRSWKQAAYCSYKLHSIFKKTVITPTPAKNSHATSSRDMRWQGLVPIKLYKCVATHLRLNAKNCNCKQLRIPFKGQMKTSTTICKRFYFRNSGHSMGTLYHHLILLFPTFFSPFVGPSGWFDCASGLFFVKIITVPTSTVIHSSHEEANILLALKKLLD